MKHEAEAHLYNHFHTDFTFSDRDGKLQLYEVGLASYITSQLLVVFELTV